MTCIVAAVTPAGNIIMGGDAAGVDPGSGELELRSDAKVFRRGRLLFGVAGSWRVNQELKSKPLPVPPIGVDTFDWMVTVFLPWLRKEIDSDALNRSEMLVGLEGTIYHIYKGEQVAVEINEYDACGSGAQVARGSLYTSEPKTLDTRHRLYKALQAAERFCSGVRGPFLFVED